MGLAATSIIARDEALPGRDEYVYAVPQMHEVLGTPLRGPWPEGTAVMYLAMGCFWGAEKALWALPGVVTTAVGYMGGFTPHPTYEEVCTGRTGHAETVMVAYDPTILRHEALLQEFWEEHDPTQGFRQGNDVGTQYRSAIFYADGEQRDAAEATSVVFTRALAERGFGALTTQIADAGVAGPFCHAKRDSVASRL